MGDGNQLYGSDEVVSRTFKVHEDLIEQYDATLDERGYESRSESIRQHVREVVESHTASDEYLPNSERDRELYEACLGYSNERLILNLDHKASVIARETGIPADVLGGELRQLDLRGYVRRQEGTPIEPNPPDRYRVKPRTADPEQWKYRRDGS